MADPTIYPTSLGSGKFGCPTITFSQSAVVFQVTSFNVDDTENVTEVRGSVNEPLCWFGQASFISGTATLIWPLSSDVCPAKDWTFTMNRRIGASATSETYAVTRVGQPQSNSSVRMIDISFRKTTV